MQDDTTNNARAFRLTLAQRDQVLAYILLALPLAVILAIILYPLWYNIWVSLHGVTLANLGEKASFVGFKNYIRALKNPDFVPSLVVDLIYAVLGTILTVALGLISAILLNREFCCKKALRGFFLFPYIVPLVPLTFVWQWILNPVYGVGNFLLAKMHLLNVSRAWLSERPWALIMVVLFAAWRYFPFAMLMLLARLQAIPQYLYDAAEVDGANGFQRFLHVTLPQVWRTMGVVALLRFMWSFNKFDDIYLLTSGAAGTKTPPIMIYKIGFESHDFGQSAAVAMFLFVILLTILPLYIRKVLKW